MEVLIGYLIIYISIICGSICISNIFNKKIESCIVLDIIIKMILLYIFGLLGQLYIGTIIIKIIPIILSIIIIIKNRKSEQLKNNILTKGFVFFTIIYFAFILFTYKKMSNIWDEYSFWSVASKKMFYSNQLLNKNLLTSYPPFPTLLQYYFTVTIGKYSQGIELFANIVFGFSLLIPIFERIKNNTKIPNICLCIIIICIPAIFQGVFFYQAIYVDSILGMLMGYIFYQIYFEKDEKFKMFSIILSFVGLTFIKFTGFYLALILIGILILYKIISIIFNIKNSKCGIEKLRIVIKNNLRENKKFLINIFIILLIVLLLYFSWSIYCKGYSEFNDPIEEEYIDTTNNSNNIIDALKTIKTTIFGSNDDSVDYDTSNRTITKSLLNKYAIIYPIRLSLISFMFLYIIGALIIYKFIIKGENKYNFISLMISIFIGFVIYVLFLQLAYITIFGIEEALKHASIDRYINTYFLAMTILLISIIIEKFEESGKSINFKYIIITLIILSFTQLDLIKDSTIASGNYNATIRYNLTSVINAADFLRQKLNSDDRVYLINQESDEKPSTWQLKYFVIPKIEIRKTRKFNKELEEANFKNGTLLETLKKLLYEEYDYIYVYKTDEYFDKFAKDIFKNLKIKDYTLYKIEKNNDNQNIKLMEVK